MVCLCLCVYVCILWGVVNESGRVVGGGMGAFVVVSDVGGGSGGGDCAISV